MHSRHHRDDEGSGADELSDGEGSGTVRESGEGGEDVGGAVGEGEEGYASLREWSGTTRERSATLLGM